MLDSIPVYTADREVVINMTGHKLVRGLWTLYKRKTENNVNDFLKDKRRIAVLVDVVNPVNVGAIFRSAAALGMDGVLLTHSSVDPLTRRTARVSMGTVFQIPWAQASLEDSEYSVLMKLIGSYGYKTVAMALTDDSVSVDNDEIRANERIAVLLGTEGTGLPKEIIDTSDYRVRIPMFHGVDSLNVAAASAVSFWELTKNGSVSI
jgi:tRNA G18 (ribose-2'-O)-methylase SpoU